MCGIPVVVQMNLHVCESPVPEPSKAVEKFRPISLLGKEKRVLGRSPGEIGEFLGKSWIPFDPRSDAGSLNRERRPSVSGLEVVCDTEKDVGGAVKTLGSHRALQLRRKKTRKPELSVSRK
jgi:hypothetical protein